MSKFVSLFVSLVCCATFIYQFGLVTRDYLQYKTITKVEYRLYETIELPAFTVAFETLIPMYNLWHEVFPSKRYPHKTIEEGLWEDSILGEHCANISKAVKATWNDSCGKDDNCEAWECFLHYKNPPVKRYLSGLDRYHGNYFICESPSVNKGSACAKLSFCDPETASYSVGYKRFIGVTQFTNLDSSCLNLSTEEIVEVAYNYSYILPFKNWDNLVQMHSANDVPNFARARNSTSLATKSFDTTELAFDGCRLPSTRVATTTRSLL